MLKKITLIVGLAMPLVTYASSEALIKELKHLKPLDNAGVQITKVVESGSLYILKLKVQDDRGTKYVPAAVTKDRKHVVIGTSYNSANGNAEGVEDLTRYEKDEAFVYGGGVKGGDFYVFTDPDCPACQAFEKQLFDEGLVQYARLHVFFYPLDRLHPNSRKKCEYLLSLPKEKRADAYKKVQGEDEKWKKYTASDKVKLKMSIFAAYGNAMGIKGTPTFFDRSGNEIDGRVLISYLRAVKRSMAGKQQKEK